MWNLISYYNCVEKLFLLLIIISCITLVTIGFLISINVIPDGWMSFTLI